MNKGVAGAAGAGFVAAGSGGAVAATGTVKEEREEREEEPEVLAPEEGIEEEAEENGGEPLDVPQVVFQCPEVNTLEYLEGILGGRKEECFDKEIYFGGNSALAGGNFTGLETSSTRSEINTQVTFGSWTANNMKYGGYKTGDFRRVKSNLRITVDRQEYKSGKWHGKFTWFWSFEKDGKGFVTFNQAVTNAAKKALVLTGGFYYVEKTKDNVWKVKFHKKVSERDNRTLNHKTFYKYFPKPYWYTKIGGFDQVYYTNWDFINGGGELQNSLCTEGVDCGEANKYRKVKQNGEWEYISGQWWENMAGWWGFEWYNKTYDWAGDHDYDNQKGGVRWFEFMYGRWYFDIKHRLESFDVGTWAVKKDKWLRRQEEEQWLRYW